MGHQELGFSAWYSVSFCSPEGNILDTEMGTNRAPSWQICSSEAHRLWQSYIGLPVEPRNWRLREHFEEL